MKYKNLKKIILTIICMLVTFSYTEVHAFTGYLDQGQMTYITGVDYLPGTHNMRVNVGGSWYDAYCAWYEKAAPNPGNYTFEAAPISQSSAIGLTYILNGGKSTPEQSVDQFFIDLGMNTPQEKRVIKTMAANIFLSSNMETAGIASGDTNRFDAKRFDNGKPCDYTNTNNLICKNKTNYPQMLTDLMFSTRRYDQAIGWLAYNAFMAASGYIDSNLTITNLNEPYKLVNGYYEKTYYLQSNTALTDISVTIDGIDMTNRANGEVIKNVAAKQVTVKVKAELLQGHTKPKTYDIKISAQTIDQLAQVYIADQDRNKYQDIVIVGLGFSPLTITANDKIVLKTCYRSTIECDNKACENTNKNNDRVCKNDVQKYWSLTCDPDDEGTNQYGVLTYNLGNGCSLYCKEDATASYPGNVNPAITLGTNIEWPTNSKGMYPLKTQSTMKCQVVSNGMDAQACLQLAQKRDYTYIGNDAVAKVVYNDTKHTQTIELESSCTTNSNFSGSQVTINNSCDYTLPMNKNIAINKETIEFVNQISEEVTDAVTNYILIKKYNGVLPVSGYNWNDAAVLTSMLFNKKYNLEITDLPLGYAGKFTASLNVTPYICNYKVTTDISGNCSCPPGSKYSGLDLYGQMKEKAQTCAEAKEIYCNSNDLKYTCKKPDGMVVDITDCVEKEKDIAKCEKDVGCKSEVCPPGTTYAGYPYQEDRNYKACIYGGGTQNDCVTAICNCGSACEYVCPQGTDFEGMDISTCVFEQQGNGKNLADAKKHCEKKCNSGGGSIIYRTISLENPFPSKDGDSPVSQSGLALGMFNDTVKGRYPGSNWNSTTLVKDKILNNRGYDGSAIYQEATPLYTITLDAVAIRQIREYNKQQVENEKGGYADFELSCTDGAYCISRFLHNGMFTTAAGESIIDAQNSTCANAKDKASFISCYTYGSRR